MLHPPLTFEAANHDDLFSIIERSRTKGVFDDDIVTALELGMKLFTEVMLTHMQDESAADMIFPHCAPDRVPHQPRAAVPRRHPDTGSPAGNGSHYDRYLRPGDVMGGAIAGIGTQRTPSIAAA